MTSSLILNEALMIKDRLREAYNTIQLVSDNDFIQDSTYKHSHQVLHARIKALEDEDDSKCQRTRYVEDVIPQSNLAKYGRYPYNEFRERSYTPCQRGTAFFHPYMGKCDLIREPWMLPEVEQIFIHTMFSSSDNFSLYENELEKLYEYGYGDETYRDLFSFNSTPDYQKSSTSSLDHSLDKSPAGSSSSNNDHTEQNLNFDQKLPHYFQVAEYGGYKLRQRILSDEVKNLWGKKNVSNNDRLIEVYKSLMGNVIFNEDEYRNSLKPDDSDLQKLVTYIISLNNKIPSTMDTAGHNVQDSKFSPSNEPTFAPQRRLYSDVVQGTKMAPKSSKSLHEPSSPKSNGFNDDFPSAASSTTIFLHSDNVVRSATDFIERLQLDAPSTSASIGHLETSDFHEEKTGEASATLPPRKQSPSRCSYSEAVNSTCGYPINQFNMPFFNNDALCDNQLRSTSGSHQTSFYNAMQSANDTTFTTNSNYNRLSYSTSAPTYPTQTYTNQQHQVPLNRTPNVNPNWYVAPPCRSSPYSVLLLPQMPTKHRWTSPQYVRPTTPTSLYAAGTSQNQSGAWPNQSATIHRSASNHQVHSCYTIYDPTKAKKKTVAPTVGKFPRSKTPEAAVKSKKFAKKSPSSVSNAAVAAKCPCKILTKPHSDFRIMTRRDCEGARTPSPTGEAAAEPPIAVGCSESDELEKIALREYQSSHDMFFTEIERQAEEQYDGNPENFCRPPNSGRGLVLVGGQQFTSFSICNFLSKLAEIYCFTDVLI